MHSTGGALFALGLLVFLVGLVLAGKRCSVPLRLVYALAGRAGVVVLLVLGAHDSSGPGG